jgi:hypothetical protein
MGSMSFLTPIKIMLLRRRARVGMRAPIFIVGCGHSGTTLLVKILGMHSRIHAIPRETNFAYGKPAYVWRRMAEFARETRAAGKDRWIEKTPKHVHRIPLLLSLHPDARVVVLVRDG